MWLLPGFCAGLLVTLPLPPWDASRLPKTSTNILCSNIVGIITSVLTPYMLNPGEWNWSNYTGFFWVGSVEILSIGDNS